MRSSSLAPNLLLLLAIPLIHASEKPPKPSQRGTEKSSTLRFVSPLQSLTLFSKSETRTHRSPRTEFLPRFREGIAAEKRIRDDISREAGLYGDDEYGDEDGWERKSEEEERRREEGDEERVGGAYDRAAAVVGTEGGGGGGGNVARSKYQFVGVVQNPSGVQIGDDGEKKIRWYAKKRAKGSKWNLRLVHPNREAIIKDLYSRGKVDICGEYINTGKSKEVPSGLVDKSTVPMPIIKGKYSVKERSWRTLWNFSPKHFFTDSSGAFWRERRLPPGLYTDGNFVYQNHYRYTDGKNGMKPVAYLGVFLETGGLDEVEKEKLERRLREGSPDVVIEE